MSVLMSAWGPVILGYGLTKGHSTTQISDFLRRTAELLALIVSLYVFTRVNGSAEMSDHEKRKLESRGNTFAGCIMCLSGVIMIVMALMPSGEDKGNVVLALIVAFSGVVFNGMFFRRYTSLFHKEGNSVIGVQARLYRAKFLVDTCVCTALGSLLLFSDPRISSLIDSAGAVLVSVYMIRCGMKTIREYRMTD